MTDLQEWEQQLRRSVAEIRDNGQQLAAAVTSVRGRGETRGVSVEVDASGDITDLQIAPGAMRWTNTQLIAALLDCQRKARAEAGAKVDRLIKKTDPRIRQQVDQVRGVVEEAERRPMTEEEIQAADDAYYERINRGEWQSS